MQYARRESQHLNRGGPRCSQGAADRILVVAVEGDGLMAKKYDAIVVGGRCAGSPTAMLLARKGYRVLMVDRASFPSDHMSSHFIHSPGVAALKRWGLLE